MQLTNNSNPLELTSPLDLNLIVNGPVLDIINGISPLGDL